MAFYTKNFIRASKQISSRVSAKFISPISIRYALGQGFNIESFNATGHVQLGSILALCDHACTFNYLPMTNNCAFLDNDKLLSYISFVATTDVSIGAEMYDPSMDKSEFDIQFTLCHVGTSSMTLKYEFFFPKSEKSVTTGHFKSILIDPETRRPCPLPPWWREKYSPYLPQNASSYVSGVSRKPDEKLYSFTTKILPSSIDSNFHFGWYSQAKLFMDAYVSWNYKKFGFDGKGNPYRNVKYMQLLFKNEASLGDPLKIDIHSVPGNENSCQLFMDHASKERNSISECLLEFFPIISNQECKNKL